MRIQRRDLLLFLLWVGITTVIGGATAPTIALVVNSTHQFLPAYLPMMITIGIGQWLILRSFVRGAGWGWIVASASGALIIIPELVYSFSWDSDIKVVGSQYFWQGFLVLGIGAAFVGALVGLAQVGVLGHRMRNGQWWVLLSALGWGLGWPLGFQILSVVGGLDSIVIWGTIWMVISLVTGAGLLRLLSQPSPSSSLPLTS